MTNWQPAQDRVLIELDEVETTTESGIYLPGAENEKPETGAVVKVGPLTSDMFDWATIELREGTKVTVKVYSGHEFEFDEKKYALIHVQDILLFSNE